MAREQTLRRVTPRIETALVVACGLDRGQRAYVVDGLRRSAESRFIDSFDELECVLPGLSRCDAVVLAARDSRGRDALATVERIARHWPATAIVIFCPPRAEPPPIRSLALAGAHEFVFEGVHDTAAALALAVENARRGCAADAVFQSLQALIPTELHSLVHAVVSRPDALASVAQVATAMGVHRKTLVNRCARCGSLAPAELILWCRLGMVGHLLERTGSTVESIAITLGFASHTALRNLVKRYTHLRATDIRRGGGLEVVLEAFSSRLAAWRDRELPIA